jgi:hypothetical protein
MMEIVIIYVDPQAVEVYIQQAHPNKEQITTFHKIMLLMSHYLQALAS